MNFPTDPYPYRSTPWTDPVTGIQWIYNALKPRWARYAVPGGGGGATNLTLTRNSTSATVLSDTGTDAVIPAATTSLAGLLTGTDKTKLDGVATGATANAGTVTTVSVATANGVSGSVANATTTPAITLTLGAITPSTVNGLTITANGTNTLNISAGQSLIVTGGGTIAAGSAAYSAASAFQAADAQLTSLAALTYAGNGGQYVRLNATATDFEFGTPAGAAHDALTLAASVTDVLGLGGAQVLTPVNATADKIVFWDESESKWSYLSMGTGITIGGTSLNVTVTQYSHPNHSGDATSVGDGAITLATVNSNVGSFGSATAAATFTVNAKGLVTAAGSTTVTPAVGSITGLGTGVATALAVAVGSAGAPVVNGGALGTPTSGTLSSCTGVREPWVFLLSGPEVTTVATTGRKAWFRVTQACTLAAADVSVDAVTAPTVTDFTADIEKNGTSIYSTRPAIQATEISSSTGVQGTMSSDPTSFAVGDIIGIWVDVIGSAGAGFSMTCGFKF